MQSQSDLAGRLAGLRTALLGGDHDLTALSDEQRLEVLHQIELLGRAAAGVGARLQAAFRSSQVQAQLAEGVSPTRAGLAVGDDLALARLTSPYWGRRELTSARALVEQMPRTLTALEEGTISPYQARQVTELTTCLSQEDRQEVDARLVDVLPGIAPSELVRTVRALVYEIDPQGFVARARKAAADRGVSLRAAPDVMGILTARLPAASAIAVFQSLQSAAKVKRSSGDPRTLNQLMADELYERLTGRQVVDGVDVEVGVVITDTALFAGTSDPAELIGYGPVPAELARDLLRPAPEPPEEPGPSPATTYCPDGPRCVTFSCTLVHGAPAPTSSAAPRDAAPRTTVPDPASSPGGSPNTPADSGNLAGTRAATVWIRRLFTDPVTGTLVQRDPRRRAFTGALRAFLVARDRTCRNAWCGAPVRHIDHITRHADGGLTEEANGRGLCARCNLAREHPRHLIPSARTYRPPPPLLPIFPRVPAGP